MKRKKRIILSLLIPGRDFGVAYVLAKILEKNNCDCIIAHNGNYVSRLLKAWKPDAVYFVTLSKYKAINNAYPNAKLFYCASEGGYWEESSDEIKIFRNNNSFSSIDKIYMWSDVIREELKNVISEMPISENEYYESLLSKFITVGNPKLDLINYLGKEGDYKSRKVRVGLVGNFYGLNAKDGVNVLGKIVRTYANKGSYSQDGFWASPEEDVGEIQSQVTLLVAYMQIIDKLGTDDYEYSIRPYPLEDFSQYNPLINNKSSNVKLDSSIDYGTWLAQQDVLIGVTSTTILPIAMTGKTYLNMDILCGRKSFDVFFFREIEASLVKYSPCSVDEAISMIKRKDEFKLSSDTVGSVMKGFSDSKLKGSAISRIANDILEELRNLPSNSFRFGIPTWVVNLLNQIRYKDPGNSYSYFDSKTYYNKAVKEFDSIVKNIINYNS
jgi:surface carbohydrate biosynthesis protein